MNGTARRPAPPDDDDHLSDALFEVPSIIANDDEDEVRAASSRRHPKRDLLAESRRIREECDDLVRLYQEALCPRREEPSRRTISVRERQDQRATSDAAWRRKALLLLLIEELV